MFDISRRKGRNYSYADQKNYRHRVRRIILGVIVFFIAFTVLTSFVFSVIAVENETMAPNLNFGDRLIFSSYMINSLFPVFAFDNDNLPFKRGDIVLVDTYKGEKAGWYLGLADSVLLAFTARRFGIAPDRDYLFVKRVIGLPGDEVSMSNFVVRVKAKGSAYSLTEFEVTEREYVPEIPQVPALWDSSLPFSGNMDTIVLGENECFVLSDDRSSTNDSRTWGPVSVNAVKGKALFRYWPLTRIGRP